MKKIKKIEKEKTEVKEEAQQTKLTEEEKSKISGGGTKGGFAIGGARRV